MSIYKLNNTDRSILKLLQENARMTLKEIAKKLHVSTTPIFDRIKKMEKAGVIKNYVTLIDHKKVGKSLIVFINISLKEHDKSCINRFVESITKFPEVIECHHITGNADFLLKLILVDIEAYNQFILDKLSIIPEIGKVESRFSLSVRKMATAIPL